MKKQHLKHTALLLFALLFCSACADRFTIVGTLPAGVTADSVHLYSVDMASEPVVISSVPVKDGHFTFKGTVPDTITLAVVHPGRLGEYPNVGWNLILEKGEIHVDTTLEFGSGTPLNDGLAQWMEEITPIIQMMMLGSAENCLDEFFNEHWEEHSKDFIGSFFLMQTWPMMDFDKVDKLVAQIPEELHNVYMLKKNLFEPVQNARDLQPGKPFKDAQLQTLDGGSAKLSDYIGKGSYTLLDFWASWCGPCRQVMPQLKELVAKHPGLTVVGVAINDKPDETRQAIDSLAIPWPVISDPQAATGQLYAFDAIPYMMLFAPDGTIVARGFHPDNHLDSLLTALIK